MLNFSGILQLRQFVASFLALSDLTLSPLRTRLNIIPLHIPTGGHPLTHFVLHGDYHIITTVSRWLTQPQLARNLR